MCGIAGYFLKTPAEHPEHLRAMVERIRHRGPDGEGFYTSGQVGFAHARLSIIDLSGGAQPLYNEDRSLVLIANGEIYNYLELRTELEALGHRFSTHSDCETLLHAYETWGEGFLEKVCGMFAFALHDVKLGRLLLARDRLGIKPLYVTRNDQGLFFASELKALLPFLDRKEVSPTGLVQFLQNNFTSGPDTLLQGVVKLMPGSILSLDTDGQLVERCYWSPMQIEPSSMPKGQALDSFDALMEEVIAIHLRSDVPFGLFLSGGVDSSLLAALIARRVREPLRTFSIGFPDSSAHNELSTAKTVAERLGTRHSAFEVQAEEMLERLPHAVWAADDLTADYANLPVSLLAERAGDELKVVFSGEGGDETFAGYGRYRQPWLKRRLMGLLHPGSGGFRTKGIFSGAQDGLFKAALAESMHDWRCPFRETWQGTPPSWTDLMRMQTVDLQTWLPDDLLVKADRMLMAWGVEGRVPFLDHRIVEFGMALPDDFKVQGRNGKCFLKEWGERFFPREHLWSRKKGFTVPVRDWLRGERLERMARVLPGCRGVSEWFEPAALAQLIERQRQRGDTTAPLWGILNFAVWHRLFIEGDGAMPSARIDPLDFLAA